MSTTPPSSSHSDRRGALAAALAIAIAIAVVAVVGGVALSVFFGSEAPDAPTLDDALKALVPTPSPG